MTEAPASPILFHLRLKMGPLCLLRLFTNRPSVSQMRANPSYEPVANSVPSMFQSNVVTSLLLFGLPHSLSSPFSSAATPAPERPNILVVLTDDQRFDQLGCAGHPVLLTPHMDNISEPCCA
jgi:hypothetical protein